MSFGGYKFSGHIVDNTQYSTSIERCLAIHAARVRSFIESSNLVENPWNADPNWLNGDISIDVITGDISIGVSNGQIHSIKSQDGNFHGFSSYFKYDNGTVVGYYYILTTDAYYVSYDSLDPYNQDRLILSNDSIIKYYNSISSSSYFGPFYASCFHCLSLDPFGQDLFNLIGPGSRSTRLQSIGFNCVIASSNPSGKSNGFVGVDNYTTQYGYAIKDKDIIVFSGYGSTPFSSVTDSHVVILSLNGFSELYNKDDNYPFLALDIKNYNSSTQYEYASNSNKGTSDQVLSTTGDQLCNNSSSTYFNAYILQDVRTCYSPSGAQYTPFIGLTIGIRDTGNGSRIPFSNSSLLTKGCTNPELVSCNMTKASLGSTKYTPALDNTLLYLYSLSSSSPNVLYGGNQFSNSSGSFSGYYNFYIGWDASNPDILADSAWPEYNAEMHLAQIASIRTENFSIDGVGGYYFQINDSDTTITPEWLLVGLNIEASADSSNNETSISLYNQFYGSNTDSGLGLKSEYIIELFDSSNNSLGNIAFNLYDPSGNMVNPADTVAIPDDFLTGALHFNVHTSGVGAYRTPNFTIQNVGEFYYQVDETQTTYSPISDLDGALLSIYVDQSNNVTVYDLWSQTLSAAGIYQLSSVSGTYYIENEITISNFAGSGNDVVLVLHSSDGSIAYNWEEIPNTFNYSDLEITLQNVPEQDTSLRTLQIGGLSSYFKIDMSSSTYSPISDLVGASFSITIDTYEEETQVDLYSLEHSLSGRCITQKEGSYYKINNEYIMTIVDNNDPLTVLGTVKFVLCNLSDGSVENSTILFYDQLIPYSPYDVGGSNIIDPSGQQL